MSRINKKQKHLYLDQTFGLRDSFVDQIQQAVKDEGVERMQISPHEARILEFLVHISKAKKVVEVGTLYGYSALHLARALPTDGQLWTLDSSAKRHKKAQDILKSCPDYKKIQWVCGKAMSSLKMLSNQAPFDMIFIDADKETYLDYLYWAQHNLKQGGLLVADNTFLFGAVYGESDRCPKEQTIKIIKEFNQILSSSIHWKGALIPTDEGLTVSIKQ